MKNLSDLIQTLLKPIETNPEPIKTYEKHLETSEHLGSLGLPEPFGASAPETPAAAVACAKQALQKGSVARFASRRRS